MQESRNDAGILVLAWDPHAGPTRYVSHLHRELGRAGAVLPAGPLADALDDVESWLNGATDKAMSSLSDPEAMDRDKLARRRAAAGADGHKIRPRIDLVATLTRPGNLSVFWQPTSYVGAAGAKEDDWIEFHHGSGHSERPTNELLYVRGARALRDSNLFHGDQRALARLLSMAALSAYEKLVARLSASFEVTRKSGFDIDLAETDGVGGAVSALSSWDVHDVARRADEEKRAFVAGFEADYGISMPCMLGLMQPLPEKHPQARLTLSKRCALLGWTRAAERLAEDEKGLCARVRKLVSEGYVVDRPEALAGVPPAQTPAAAEDPDEARAAAWHRALGFLSFNDSLMIRRINEDRGTRGEDPYIPKAKLTADQRRLVIEEYSALPQPPRGEETGKDKREGAGKSERMEPKAPGGKAREATKGKKEKGSERR